MIWTLWSLVSWCQFQKLLFSPHMLLIHSYSFIWPSSAWHGYWALQWHVQIWWYFLKKYNFLLWKEKVFSIQFFADLTSAWAVYFKESRRSFYFASFWIKVLRDNDLSHLKLTYCYWQWLHVCVSFCLCVKWSVSNRDNNDFIEA